MTNNRDITEYTMEVGRAHKYIFLMTVPLLLVTLFPFLLIWDINYLKEGWAQFYNYFIPVILSGIIIHELLHGIGWSFFVPGGMKSIKFGINWKFLAPYCHCKSAMKVQHYRIGAALPLLVLGVFPVIFALASGNGTLLLFGILFIWGAGGDIISLVMLRKLESGSMVYDHPHKLGFYTRQ